jgi:hypothetical protein
MASIEGDMMKITVLGAQKKQRGLIREVGRPPAKQRCWRW